MVVTVKILSRSYGDKVQTMSVLEFQQKYGDKHRWAIFAEDTANPENSYQIRDSSKVEDGQSLTLVPQIAGG